MSNYMQLSFTAMKVLLLHLALLILLVLDSHAQLNLDAIGRAVDDLEKARGQQAELFSPKSFAQAYKEYERYLQVIRQGKSDREIQAVLARFRAAINITMDHILQVHTTIGELITLRQKALTLSAPIIVPKEFEEAEKRFTKTIEKLDSSGYERSVSVFDPGYYSSRGDVLDIYPVHFRNPFRISYNFDRIEAISIFDPLSQLTTKSIKTLSFRDFNSDSYDINNISLMMIHPDISVCLISRLGNKIVLSHLEENGRIDLSFSPVVLLNKSKRKRLKKVARLSKNVTGLFILDSFIHYPL